MWMNKRRNNRMMMALFLFTTIVSRQSISAFISSNGVSSAKRMAWLVPSSYYPTTSGSHYGRFSTTTSRRSSMSQLFSTTSKDEMTNNKKKKRNKKGGKEKRRQFIGMAKAVDRGQFSVVYAPGGESGIDFQAKSGLPNDLNNFVVLGIESSCDDTGAAIVRNDGTILGEALASQTDIHEEFGGVVPGLAKTAHEENIQNIIDQALHNANMTLQDIDAIGVTVGPGLEICLRVGCNAARQLAIQHNKPFVAIHHLEAHILMSRRNNIPNCQFPFLALLVSGGHCQILKCMGIGNYTILGGTLDDSLGMYQHLYNNNILFQKRYIYIIGNSIQMTYGFIII